MGTTGQSITLANSIIGVGILAMPFCFQQCGVLLATLILLLMGLVSRLCCYFLLKSALLARRRNFEFLAFHVFGPAGKLAVEVGIIGFLMGTCIAYFVVVGDLGPQIVAKMFNINQSDMLRTSIMVCVSLVCVLPLGLLRNVDSLSNVSAATICFYFCLVIKVIVEAASQLLSGEWHKRVEMWRPAGVLQCVPIFSMALFCQTQLFEIFESMPTLSLEKMNVVTKNAINICTSVYFTLGLFGYIAFSWQDISGNILMSLSPTMGSDVIKLGFVMSVACSFPLIIFPCRASLYSLLYKKAHPPHHDHIINHSIPERTFRCITVAIIAVTLFVSLLVPNIELVLGLVGSTIGVMVCLVFPAACFVNVTFKNTNERLLAKAILVLGLLIMVLGTYANLQAAENKLDRYDEKTITQERIDKIVEDFFHKMEKDGDFTKQLNNKEDIQKDIANKVMQEVKDSEIQPPNPIPPASSNEKKDEPVQDKKQKGLDQLKKVQETVDKASELHQKNLKTKLNELKLVNEEKSKENNIEKPNADIPKPATNQDKAQDKLDMMKQQQLIETIKQHGEEQKELIKEQKEILDELKKTKDEIQQSKKDVDSSEAKKIAVESIQKIANVAIKSLSGVTDKPVGNIQNGGKNSDPLEKIANDAVQEIAKKAVETIEAIKEIQEKPKESVINPDINKAEIANGNLNTGNNVANPGPAQSLEPQANVNGINSANNPQVNPIPVAQALVQDMNNVPHLQANINQPSANIQANNQHSSDAQVISNTIPVNQPIQQVDQPVQNAQPIQNGQPVQNAQQIQNGQLVKSQPVQNAQPIQNEQLLQQSQLVHNTRPVQNEQYVQSNQPVQSNLNQYTEQQKAHAHSLDEPQSYKQGEDLQNKNSDGNVGNIAQNLPLPLAMNGNNQVKRQIDETIKSDALKPEIGEVNVQNSINNVQNNGASKDNIADNNIVKNDDSVPIRQKREVVNCADKLSLKPGDKEICNTMLNNPNSITLTKDSEEVLKKIDLNDVLPKSLSDSMIHLRSLKSYEESEGR